MKNKIYLSSILTTLIFCLLSSVVTAQLVATDGVLHFNSATQPSQRLVGNNSALLTYYSRHSSVAHLAIYDKEAKRYGGLYGNGDGANFGLLDGDGNWSYLAVKDNYTSFRINNSEKMRIKSNGYVGIGTNVPAQRLHVKGVVRASFVNDLARYVEIYHGGTNGSINNAGAGNLDFRQSGATIMSLKPDGKVVIGDDGYNNAISTPAGYRLYVTDGILTEKVRVATEGTTDWADYVFEEDYDLNSTEEVENFIEENGHLPNVPSAAEVNEKGVDMVEMDATLLRQIEELWLHVIDMKKENEQAATTPPTEKADETAVGTTELNISVLNQIEKLQSQIVELKKHVTELEIQLEQK